MSLSNDIGAMSGVAGGEMVRLCSGTNAPAVGRTALLTDGNEGAWEMGVTEGLPSEEVSTD